jgi:hypothetical protein
VVYVNAGKTSCLEHAQRGRGTLISSNLFISNTMLHDLDFQIQKIEKQKTVQQRKNSSLNERSIKRRMTVMSSKPTDKQKEKHQKQKS